MARDDHTLASARGFFAISGAVVLAFAFLLSRSQLWIGACVGVGALILFALAIGWGNERRHVVILGAGALASAVILLLEARNRALGIAAAVAALMLFSQSIWWTRKRLHLLLRGLALVLFAASLAIFDGDQRVLIPVFLVGAVQPLFRWWKWNPAAPAS